MKNKVTKILWGVLIMVGIFSLPTFSFAEMQIEVQDGEINVEIAPNNPQPYEDVTIKISSYATDLNKAIIVWQTNGKIVLTGIGKTTYSFKVGGPDTSNIFNIKITPYGSVNSISKNISINPSEIEMVWESVDGYTPLFYKGKSLPIKEGFIRVVAIPNTSTIKSGSGSVSYTWKNKDSAILDVSGYNKNTYTFKNNMFDKKNTITVIASSVSNNYTAEKTVEIPTYSPKVLFYKKSPTEGIQYNKVLDSNTIFTGEEMTVVAEPYFLAIKGSEDLFSYKWTINGDPIKTPSKKTELTIVPTSRGGYANIGVTFENINKLFQKVSGTLKLTL